eukprot:jgi/Undpi1/12798/HiC_scaffold_7.g02465.m1
MACENRRRKQQSHATTLHELDVRDISFTNVDAPFVAIPRRTTAYEDDKLRIEWEVTMNSGESRNDILRWLLTGACVIWLFVIEHFELFRHKNLQREVLSIISAWYLLERLWTLLESLPSSVSARAAFTATAVFFISVDSAGLFRPQQLLFEVLSILSAWYLLGRLLDLLKSQASALPPPASSAPATAEATRQDDATVAPATGRAKREGIKTTTTGQDSSHAIAGLSPTICIPSAVPVDTAAELEMARHQASATASITTAVAVVASPDLAQTRQSVKSDTGAATAACSGYDTTVPDFSDAENTVANTRAELTYQAGVAPTTTAPAGAIASAELALVPPHVKSPTSTATAACDERDAPMPFCSNEATTEAQIRAELAAQASAAAADAAASAAAAVVASSEIAMAQEEASRANSCARTAARECNTARLERHQERFDNKRLQSELKEKDTENARLQAELKEKDNAAITAAEELITAREKVLYATSASNEDAEGRWLAETGRASAVAAVAELRVSLKQKENIATAANEELAAARKETDRLSLVAKEAIAGRQSLEHERNTAAADSFKLRQTLKHQIAIAAATTETLQTYRHQANLAALKTAADAERCRSAELERDVALADSAALREELATQTAATATVTKELDIYQHQANLAALETAADAERCRSAELERDVALADSAALGEELATQTAATATVTKELDIYRHQANLAALKTAADAERCRSAELERDVALADSAALREELATQTAATATVTEELDIYRHQANLAALETAADAERCRSAELERDVALADSAALREELATQTAATATVTKEYETARMGADRAALAWKADARERDMLRQERETASSRAVVELRAALKEQITVTASITVELESCRKEASRAALLAAQQRRESERESNISRRARKRATAAFGKMRSRLDRITAAAKTTASQLTSARKNESLAVKEAETLTFQRDRVIFERDTLKASLAEVKSERDRVMLDWNALNTTLHELGSARDRAVSERDTINDTLVEVQAELDRMKKKRGNSALEERQASAAGTAETVMPNDVAGAGSIVARKRARIHPRFLRGEDVSPIVAFYRDGGRTLGLRAGGQGLSLSEIFEKTDEWLEKKHDYIQWLFPTQQPSRYASNAPILTSRDIIELASLYGKPRRNMVSALGKMLSFYRLRIIPDEGPAVRIAKGGNFDPNKAEWTRPSNHNALRLTRIISSLRLFELDLYANALQVFLRDMPELRDHPSQRYWQSA